MTMPREPSATAFATAASMAEVPVPEVASVSALLVGAEHAPQRRADVVEQRDEIRIEMAEHRRRHRAHDARSDQARTGAEQNTFSRRKWHR